MNNSLFKIFSLSFVLILPIGATQAADQAADGKPATTAPDSLQKKDIPESNNVDPWQGFNHAMFSFNDTTDKFLLKPIAKVYVWVTPAFFRKGVDNVLSNVMEIPSAFNGLLQGNISNAGHDSGRLLVNTTLGIGGLFDVAQYMGLKDNRNEDFGQTLAVWGVKSGPYVVLPFLGPSTLRDSFATPVDWYSDPKTYIDHVPTSNTVRAVSVVNTRANLFPLEENITGDKYTFIRDAYLQHREFMINNGVVEDSFGTDATMDENSDY